jgi:hypothetical protein
MTTKSGLQSRQERYTLFAQRRQIAANTGKGFGTVEATSKASRQVQGNRQIRQILEKPRLNYQGL